MSPLNATPKPLEPLVLGPSNHGARDAWIEKVFGPRQRQAGIKVAREQLHTFVHRSLKLDSGVVQEHSYSEELSKYIAESSATLSGGGEEPLDDSDADSSEEEAECHIDVFGLIEIQPPLEYVEPPVEVPRSYRTQDLQGGMLVGGDYVLFTNWAFKRQLRRMRILAPIRECSGEYEQSASEVECRPKGVYSGKIVEL
ncbi:unnamed protein product [Phytophthora fragariaefolia]|uniref:Unnamed protein product n=1 Tax=Phytophthora fragariaefolia TaxID=1490495 RepID=A0A9W7D875_9STRA|nr:unnamed protein product [Phytophthora fragariaefolia]